LLSSGRKSPRSSWHVNASRLLTGSLRFCIPRNGSIVIDSALNFQSIWEGCWNLCPKPAQTLKLTVALFLPASPPSFMERREVTATWYLGTGSFCVKSLHSCEYVLLSWGMSAADKDSHAARFFGKRLRPYYGP
jgi:hypothetical protein